MIIKSIQGNTNDNDKILSLVLAEQITTARNKRFPTAEMILEELQQ